MYLLLPIMVINMFQQQVRRGNSVNRETYDVGLKIGKEAFYPSTGERIKGG